MIQNCLAQLHALTLDIESWNNIVGLTYECCYLHNLPCMIVFLSILPFVFVCLFDCAQNNSNSVWISMKLGMPIDIVPG